MQSMKASHINAQLIPCYLISNNTRKKIGIASFGSCYYLPEVLARFISGSCYFNFFRLLYPFGKVTDPAGSMSIFIPVERASA